MEGATLVVALAASSLISTGFAEAAMCVTHRCADERHFNHRLAPIYRMTTIYYGLPCY